MSSWSRTGTSSSLSVPLPSNHDNHIHVRLSEQPYGASQLTAPVFAAP